MSAASQFLDLAIVIAFIAIAFSQVMSMIRLVIGPSVGDRILALDTMVVNAIGLIVLRKGFRRNHSCNRTPPGKRQRFRPVSGHGGARDCLISPRLKSVFRHRTTPPGRSRGGPQ